MYVCCILSFEKFEVNLENICKFQIRIIDWIVYFWKSSFKNISAKNINPERLVI